MRFRKCLLLWLKEISSRNTFSHQIILVYNPLIDASLLDSLFLEAILREQRIKWEISLCRLIFLIWRKSTLLIFLGSIFLSRNALKPRLRLLIFWNRFLFFEIHSCFKPARLRLLLELLLLWLLPRIPLRLDHLRLALSNQSILFKILVSHYICELELCFFLSLFENEVVLCCFFFFFFFFFVA